LSFFLGHAAGKKGEKRKKKKGRERFAQEKDIYLPPTVHSFPADIPSHEKEGKGEKREKEAALVSGRDLSYLQTLSTCLIHRNRGRKEKGEGGGEREGRNSRAIFRSSIHLLSRPARRRPERKEKQKGKRKERGERAAYGARDHFSLLPCIYASAGRGVLVEKKGKKRKGEKGTGPRRVEKNPLTSSIPGRFTDPVMEGGKKKKKREKE